MQTNFIKNLLNLEEVIIKNVKNLKEKVEIHIILLLNMVEKPKD